MAFLDLWPYKVHIQVHNEMTRSLVFKDQNGTRKYRRRVPHDLQSVLEKKEFVKVLGKPTRKLCGTIIRITSM